jgi:hypothetical protein
MKQVVAVGAALVILLTIAALPVVAVQYSPPWADVFSFDYPNDSIGKGLPTKASGDYAVSKLNAAGYHAFDNNLVSAASSMNNGYAQSDAVWAFFGHGKGGGVLFWNGTAYSDLLADSTVPPLNSTIAKAYLSPTAELGDIRLMVFAACHTANNGSQSGLYLGNLLSIANAKGIDSSLGFRDLIYWPQMTFWSYAFFQGLNDGKTVDQAAVSAMDYVSFTVGGYFGTDSWVTRGGSKKVIPAGYGS